MLKIYKLVDPDGELFDYSPDVAHQVEEIIAALKRDKEANLRQRLADLRLPRTRVPALVSDGGASLADELFPPPGAVTR